MTESLPAPQTYPELLATLKARIRDARLRAAVSVNRELILLYWEIGHDILLRQAAEGWGTSVIDRLARDLRRDFPEMTGLSPRNLKYMRAFAEAWPDPAMVQQLVAQLPWGHNMRLLEALKRLEPRRPHPSDRETVHRPRLAADIADRELAHGMVDNLRAYIETENCLARVSRQ